VQAISKGVAICTEYATAKQTDGPKDSCGAREERYSFFLLIPYLA
jgi:hypothetical protein